MAKSLSLVVLLLLTGEGAKVVHLPLTTNCFGSMMLVCWECCFGAGQGNSDFNPLLPCGTPPQGKGFRSKPQGKIRSGALKVVGRLYLTTPGSSCSQAGSKCDALQFLGLYRCGREGTLLFGQQKVPKTLPPRLAPLRAATPLGLPHDESAKRKTEITSYKSMLDRRRVGR